MRAEHLLRPFDAARSYGTTTGDPEPTSHRYDSTFSATSGNRPTVECVSTTGSVAWSSKTLEQRRDHEHAGVLR
jgi:hypothetical protein